MSNAHRPPSPVNEWPPQVGDRVACALFVVTADTRVCAANGTATAWFDPPPGLMTPLARFLGILESDDRLAELQTFIDDLRSHLKVRELRISLYRHNREPFSALLVATPLVNEAGTYLGFDAMLVDLSRWQDREDLVPLTRSESLHRRFDLLVRELAMTQRELESLSQILAHDLRGPLRHVQGYLRLIRERADTLNDEPLREYGQLTLQAAHRMGDMIEAMHDYLHLCRATLDVQDVPLGPLIEGVCAHLRLPEGGPTIEWRIDAELPVVRGDPMLLAQAFRHLLDNAVKFTRKVAHPVITIGWQRSDDGSRTFHVEDNGVGFDRRRAERLFLLFQRQHHSTEYEGLGLGLAMTNRIVERHGGTLFCDSSPGAGCRVSFTLPAEMVPSV